MGWQDQRNDEDKHSTRPRSFVVGISKRMRGPAYLCSPRSLLGLRGRPVERPGLWLGCLDNDLTHPCLFVDGSARAEEDEDKYQHPFEVGMVIGEDKQGQPSFVHLWLAAEMRRGEERQQE